MVMRGVVVSVALALFSFGCLAVGPVDDPEASDTTSTAGAEDAATAVTAQSDDGQSSMTGQVTGVSATSASTSASTSADSGFTTGADPTADPTDATDDDPTASDTSTTGSSSTPLEQCGIELPADGGNYEAGCSCESCDLYYQDIDFETYQRIASECECLCDAARCGAPTGGEAAAADDEDSEGSASDSTASTGSESTTNG